MNDRKRVREDEAEEAILFQAQECFIAEPGTQRTINEFLARHDAAARLHNSKGTIYR